jgi:hypothetical protein
MTAYCREKLHLKEDDAGRRIVAARLGTRYPAVFPMLDSGELTLSVACKLKHYIRDENHEELLDGVRGLSYREAEAWLARKVPRVDVPSRVRKLPSPKPAAAACAAAASPGRIISARAGSAVPPARTTSAISARLTISSQPSMLTDAATSRGLSRSGAPSSGKSRADLRRVTSTRSRPSRP